MSVWAAQRTEQLPSRSSASAASLCPCSPRPKLHVPFTGETKSRVAAKASAAASACALSPLALSNAAVTAAGSLTQ